MLRRELLSLVPGLFLEVRRRRAEPLPEFVVVVNGANPVARMARAEVSRLFLKRQATWPTGLPAVPFDLEGTSEVREAFSAVVHGRGAWVVVAFWQQEIASARTTPPLVCRTEDEALAGVRRTPGGIAYVALDTPLGDGVKVLALES